MAQYLDYERLQRFWNKVKGIITGVQNDVSDLSTRVETLENNGGGSADLFDYYTKEQVDANIEEVAYVTANAVNDIADALGADEKLQVSFEGTQHVADSKSLLDAIKTLDNKVGTGGGSGDAYKDVSIFAVNGRQMYIRAPKGLLTEDDKPVFARYTKSKIRGVGDEKYWVADRGTHVKVNGWIVPIMTNGGDDDKHFAHDAYLVQHEFDGDGCASWNDNYDYFRLYCEGEDFIEWLAWASYDYFRDRLCIVQKKLGIRLDRDGKTIVDYLPFSYQENDNGPSFAKWR